ncbi:MAG: membrane or secreted protein [Nonlabens sp.]
MKKPPKAEGIKQTSAVSKYFVLVILFALPLVAYLFFLQGKHNFDTLPVMVENIGGLERFETLDGATVQLKDSVSIITFLGNNPYDRLGYISNVNEKIYKKFHKFDTFQMISILPESGKPQIAEIVRQMSETTDVTDWHFVVGSDEAINDFFSSLQTNLMINDNLSSDFAFIVDKNAALRGRDDTDPDEVVVYGYDTSSVPKLQKVMMDDVRVLLAEYRFAFKKNRDDKIREDE